MSSTTGSTMVLEPRLTLGFRVVKLYNVFPSVKRQYLFLFQGFRAVKLYNVFPYLKHQILALFPIYKGFPFVRTKYWLFQIYNVFHYLKHQILALFPIYKGFPFVRTKYWLFPIDNVFPLVKHQIIVIFQGFRVEALQRISFSEAPNNSFISNLQKISFCAHQILAML